MAEQILRIPYMGSKQKNQLQEWKFKAFLVILLLNYKSTK